MAEDPSYHHQRWLKHFEGIDFEIGQLAKICQVQLLDPATSNACCATTASSAATSPRAPSTRCVSC